MVIHAMQINCLKMKQTINLKLVKNNIEWQLSINKFSIHSVKRLL